MLSHSLPTPSLLLLLICNLRITSRTSRLVYDVARDILAVAAEDTFGTALGAIGEKRILSESRSSILTRHPFYYQNHNTQSVHTCHLAERYFAQRH